MRVGTTPARPPLRTIVLDIEGTTTPIEFVYGVLFPFARERAADFIRTHAADPDVHAAIERLRSEHAADAASGAAVPGRADTTPCARIPSLVAYVHWLMDRDRKSPGLKALQGLIWKEGYASGTLRGQVFDDVPAALERFARHHTVCIFSSGSVLAQRLLFATAPAGDLTTFITRHFDTTTGSKTEAGSYRAIARESGVLPAEALFVSDVTAELDAARIAGFRTLLCQRPGNPPQPEGHGHDVIRTFDEIAP